MFVSFFKQKLGAILMNHRYHVTQKTTENLWHYPLRLINSSQTWQDLEQKALAVLIVNTATGCGLKKQLGSLQSLHETLGSAGLCVISVPSPDFMGQEKREGLELLRHCETIYGAQYLITENIHVKGSKIHPLFAWLKNFIAPKWNYQKYLFDRNGALRYVYDPRFDDFDQISEDIRTLIQEYNL